MLVLVSRLVLVLVLVLTGVIARVIGVIALWGRLVGLLFAVCVLRSAGCCCLVVVVVVVVVVAIDSR